MPDLDTRVEWADKKYDVRRRSNRLRTRAAELAAEYETTVPWEVAEPVIKEAIALGLFNQKYRQYGIRRTVFRNVQRGMPLPELPVDTLRLLSENFKPSVKWPLVPKGDFLRAWQLYRILETNHEDKREIAQYFSEVFGQPAPNLVRQMKPGRNSITYVDAYLLDHLLHKLEGYPLNVLEWAKAESESPTMKTPVAELRRVTDLIFLEDVQTRSISRVVASLADAEWKTVDHYLARETSGRKSRLDVAKRNSMAIQFLDGLEDMLRFVEDGIVVISQHNVGDLVDVVLMDEGKVQGRVVETIASDTGVNYMRVELDTGSMIPKIVTYVVGLNSEVRDTLKEGLEYSPDGLNYTGQLVYSRRHEAWGVVDRAEPTAEGYVAIRLHPSKKVVYLPESKVDLPDDVHSNGDLLRRVADVSLLERMERPAREAMKKVLEFDPKEKHAERNLIYIVGLGKFGVIDSIRTRWDDPENNHVRVNVLGQDRRVNLLEKRRVYNRKVPI